MPATYTYQDAVDICRKYIKDVPTSSIDVRLCDMVNSIIYCAYPWRWTLKALTAIALVDGTQDYALAAADAPTAAAGLYRLVRARIVRTDTTPDESYDSIDIAEYLAPSLAKGSYLAVSKVSYEPITASIRLEHAVSIGTGVTLELRGEYQRNPAKVAALATAIWAIDQYFPVFVDGLLWKVYQFSDDPRAGSVVLVKGIPQYTGQLAIFHQALEAMIAEEDRASGDPFRFPGYPLGAGRYQGGFGLLSY